MPETDAQEDELRQTITTCLDLDKPRSFFLYAGAGSGKTRAVVEALKIFRDQYGTRFRKSGQRVAVITYTNAACDEIRRRIDFDPIFEVSTIHSFAWEQIRAYHQDLSSWLRLRLSRDIEKLQEKQAAGRAGTKAAAEREVQIASKEKRIQNLNAIRQFTYNPNGENTGKNSLNHAEVIAISANFIAKRPLMRQVLIRKYPVLLIDESQDTQKDLIDALFELQAEYPNKFCLSLFGDTMQRIYADGKVGLEETIPDDWEKPAITINYRCPKRVIRLLNKIRSDVDGTEQEPRDNATEGAIRLFLSKNGEEIEKTAIEASAAKTMAEVSSDEKWLDWQSVKVLTLEHHMAAHRGGFDRFFEPLYRVSRFKTGLLDGTLSGLAFFAQQVLPLIRAREMEDRFTVAQIVKDFSPIISPDRLKESNASIEDVRSAGRCVEELYALWDNGGDPGLLEVLSKIDNSGLFVIPEVFAPILYRTNPEQEIEKGAAEDSEEDRNPAVDAWEEALSAPFSQLQAYVDYISDDSPFGTHQGIKGLQFPRVMVILDDSEARGNWFQYDKLFGAKAPTTTDMKNEAEGKETSIDKVRRLFYVTCSRAQESLALVAYTDEPQLVATYLSKIGWFQEDEIILM